MKKLIGCLCVVLCLVGCGSKEVSVDVVPEESEEVQEELTKEEVQEIIDDQNALLGNEKESSEEIVDSEGKNYVLVGNNEVKYGTYTLPEAFNGSDQYGTLIMYPDNKFHITSNADVRNPDGGYFEVDCDGSYEIIMMQWDDPDCEPEEGLQFTTVDGDEFSFMIWKEEDGSISLTDQWHSYVLE